MEGEGEGHRLDAPESSCGGGVRGINIELWSTSYKGKGEEAGLGRGSCETTVRTE